MSRRAATMCDQVGRRRGCALTSLSIALAACLWLGCRSNDSPSPSPKSGTTTTPQTPAEPVRVVKVRPSTRLAPGAGCMGAECHGDMKQLAHVHGPVSANGCDACHAPEEDGHKFPLKRSGNDLCTLCHAVLTGKSFVHAAVKQTGCRACHSPHGSETKFLLIASSIERTCRSCHAASEPGAVRHAPFAAGACTGCHLPHEADNPKLTIRTGPEHCYRCHGEIQHHVEQARTPHPPVTQNCLTCHEAHVANEAKLLKGPFVEQCFNCHKDVRETVRSATAQHGAVFTDKECLNCHDVHGSQHPRMLRDPMPEVCLRCHDKPQKGYDGREIRELATVLRKSEFLHGPIRSGECQACHQVHGSSNTSLLTKYFPNEFYKGFELTNYALCFSCHEQALVLDKQTTTMTGFRNGDRNLHFVHVNKLDRGRTCKACHEIHGSNEPKHMAQNVPFEGGGWAMPLAFRKTQTGGGCAPGCHQPYDYDRDKAVTYPAR